MKRTQVENEPKKVKRPPWVRTAINRRMYARTENWCLPVRVLRNINLQTGELAKRYTIRIPNYIKGVQRAALASFLVQLAAVRVSLRKTGDYRYYVPIAVADAFLCEGPFSWWNSVEGDRPKVAIEWTKMLPILGGSTAQSEKWHKLNYREFLKYLMSTYPNRFSTLEESHVTMQIIAQTGLAWMMEKRRPLELGFCRLNAFPYRANWQSVITRNARIKRAANREMNGGRRKSLFRYAKHFTDGHLTAWNQYQPRWSLCVTPCGQFHRITTNTEKARRRALGVQKLEQTNRSNPMLQTRLEQLITELNRELIHRSPHAMEAFMDYWKAIQSPFMDFPPSGLHRGDVSGAASKGIAPFSLKLNQGIGTDRPIPGCCTKNHNRSFRLEKTYAELLLLSDLRLDPKDMRLLRRYVARLRPRTGRTVGVPVLHADESQNAGSEMLDV